MTANDAAATAAAATTASGATAAGGDRQDRKRPRDEDPAERSERRRKEEEALERGRTLIVPNTTALPGGKVKVRQVLYREPEAGAEKQAKDAGFPCMSCGVARQHLAKNCPAAIRAFDKGELSMGMRAAGSPTDTRLYFVKVL